MATVHTDYPRSVSPLNIRPWLWPLLALLILIVGGGALWLWRPALPGPSSPEVTFARDMAAHHEQAVQMALIMRDRTQNEELRTLALDVVLTQQAQIGQMQGWLAAWNQPLTGPAPPMSSMAGMPMGLATEQDIEALRTLPVAEAEIRFLQLMIQHHQGGTMMVQGVLKQTERPEVQRLATSIVNSQQAEIKYMQDLLKQRGVSVDSPTSTMP